MDTGGGASPSPGRSFLLSHKGADMNRLRLAFWGLVLLGGALTGRADEPKKKDPPQRYEYRAEHDLNGIGKFYMGREIAQVMGHEGAGWLELPERGQEEQPDPPHNLL